MRVLFLSFLFLIGVFAAAWAFFGGQLRVADLEQAADSAKTTLAKLEDSLKDADKKKDQKPKIGSGNGFDVARVVPDGASVFAGQTEPETYVTVLADGEKVGTAKSDDIGEWVVIAEHKFKSADPKLGLTTSKTAPAKPKADTQVAALHDQPSRNRPTARDVTDRLMNQLEDMVETARKETAAPAKPADKTQDVAPAETAKATITASEAPTSTPDAATKAVKAETTPAKTGTGDQQTPTGSQPATTADKNTTGAEGGPPNRQAIAPPTTPGAPTNNATVKADTKSTSDTAPASSSTTAQIAALGDDAEPKQPTGQAPTNTPRDVAGWAEPKIAPKTTTTQAANTVDVSPPSKHNKVVPVPIKFEYRKATLTAEGRRAAALLLEYAKLKGYNALTLTGHADERGTNQLNMDLSQQRLDTVKQYLQAGGFKGELTMVPKGETEPFAGVDRSAFATQELWELDRRVELRSVE